jgi:ABC-type branched-subunit amino acid transport system ATPase component/ABC-type branched-subunit amino acid transport system permease subunit
MTPLATAFFSETTITFVVLGLATGALYALVALGVVLTYRASGVLNFAAGALGAFAAFLFYSLHDNHGWPLLPALLVALAVGAGIGALMQVLVMEVLRKVSLLGKLIACLGLMSLGQGLVDVVFNPTEVIQPNTFLPTTLVHITGSLVLGEDRLILIGGALALALVLGVVYKRTTFGLATAAVAENRMVAASSGWSPSAIELVNFSLAGVLSAGAAILLAPIVGLDATTLTLIVLPALAAALVGRFSSFTITVGAALLIGVITAVLSLQQAGIASALGAQSSSLGDLPDVVPLLIIVVAMTMRGRARLQRGESIARLPMPGDGRVPIGKTAIGIAVALTLMFTLSASWQASFLITLASGILVLSVVVLTGYAGQLSLAQYALAGFGAWVAARLAATQGFPFEAALVAGIVLTVPVGLLVALPALRTRGVDLAVATLALAEMISAIVFNNGTLTGGFVGTTVPTPRFFGLDINPITHAGRYGTFALVAFVLVALMVSNLRRGRSGRRLLAVRANERAAASLGVHVYSAKLYAFALSSAIAALAGVLIGFQNPNVQFADFDVFGSINTVLYAVVGGVGWVSGALIGAVQTSGAAMSTAINDIFARLGNLPAWLLVFTGVAVVLTLRMAPDGVAALQSAQWRQLTGGLQDRLRTRLSLPRQHRNLGPPEPGRARRPATLAVEGVTVRFGGVVALDDVSFTVSPGEVVGLIGPNGAGKTTLIDVVTGFTKPDAGSVLLDGSPMDTWSPEQRARRGLARSWQAVELFEEMTVQENLLVAADRKQPSRYLTDLVRPGRLTPNDAMNETIERFELTPHLGAQPSKLPHGIARLVGIARAIVTEPSVLLLDEPAAGLDIHESRELGQEIRAISQRSGIGILLIEHDVNLLMSICDRIVVLDFGRKIAEATPEEVGSDPAVIAAYLGEAHEAPATSASPEVATPPVSPS